MSEVKVVKSVLKYYLSCFLIVSLLLFIPQHHVIHIETICWLWIGVFALFWPSNLKITKSQIQWNNVNTFILFLTILVIPFMQTDKLFDPFNLSSFSLSLSLLLGPSVCEELLFRARFDDLCQRTTNSIWLTILNGLLFSMVHIIFKGFGVFQILTFFPGVVLWVIYKKSDNLITVILLHWLFNTAFYAQLLNNSLNLQFFF